MYTITPTKLKELCQEYKLTPSKKYGQNYLVSDAPIKKIIKAGEFSKNDVVVEVGPGFGVLTLALSPLVKKIIAFEIEKKIKPYWDTILNHKGIEQEQKEFSNIEIVWGNALFKLKEELNLKKYKIIANLPYQITSHALRTFLELKNKPEKIIVMVQKEVAERICAKPRSASSRQVGNMSLLSVSVQYYGEPKIIDRVNRGNFWPIPKVDSALLEIKNIKKQKNKFSDEDFFRIVSAGFASKRKQLSGNLAKLKNSLKMNTDDIRKNIFEVTKNEKIRAEDLSIDEWILLCNKLFINN
jgi:16S rRNA (adenine1518-N6/adenine1519-N6)-dimethyltransferase